MISPTMVASIIQIQHTGSYLSTLMTFASILFVTGLVGIAVMGFMISKDHTADKIRT